jgi:ornithine cyclodeaminase
MDDMNGAESTSPVLAVVNALALADIISMPEAIELVTQAMLDLSNGLVSAPERTAVQVAPAGKLALMPGAMAGINRFGLKALSLYSTAASHGLPGHQGVMLLFDSVTGRPLCAIDSHALTGLRTAAASAVATQALACPESRSVAVLGCGSLAELHVEAISLVRPIEEIIVWGRSIEKARHFRAQCALRSPARVTLAHSVQEAVERADIICTVTSASSPILEGRWLQPGQHLNLVGASVRATREVDDLTVVRGRFIADSRAHALSQAGELRHAMDSGCVGEQHLAGEIGEVLAGRVMGRSDPAMITIYKSLGHMDPGHSSRGAGLRCLGSIAACGAGELAGVAGRGVQLTADESGGTRWVDWVAQEYGRMITAVGFKSGSGTGPSGETPAAVEGL